MGWNEAGPRERREFIRGLVGLGLFVGVLLLGALAIWVMGGDHLFRR